MRQRKGLVFDKGEIERTGHQISDRFRSRVDEAFGLSISEGGGRQG